MYQSPNNTLLHCCYDRLAAHLELARNRKELPIGNEMPKWLPLDMFDLHSHFVLLFHSLCLDVGMDGDFLCVMHSESSGEYRSVCLGSEIDFETFLRLEFGRTIANTELT